MQQIEREIQVFKLHLERLGYSKTSISMLPACVGEFLLFTGKEISAITSKDITAYYEYLQERPNKRRSGGLSDSYIHHHIYGLKLFFSWQEAQGVITENPISSLQFKRPLSSPRDILSKEEIKQLYEAAESLRERAILSLFYGCGLRRVEGERLNLKDIHFRSNVLYVRMGKGNKRRVIPLSPGVKADLWKYATKERQAKIEEPAFITNCIGNRTRGDSYNKALKKIMERTTITKQISLHSLRHSIATHLLESGLSVEYVRDFLGHKHLESTQIYTRVKSKQIWTLSNT